MTTVANLTGVSLVGALLKAAIDVVQAAGNEAWQDQRGDTRSMTIEVPNRRI